MQTISSIASLAYFDPGSGSLLVQALVGGTAGLFVLAKLVWDRAFNGSKSHADHPGDKTTKAAGSQTARH